MDVIVCRMNSCLFIGKICELLGMFYLQKVELAKLENCYVPQHSRVCLLFAIIKVLPEDECLSSLPAMFLFNLFRLI